MPWSLRAGATTSRIRILFTHICGRQQNTSVQSLVRCFSASETATYVHGVGSGFILRCRSTCTTPSSSTCSSGCPTPWRSTCTTPLGTLCTGESLGTTLARRMRSVRYGTHKHPSRWIRRCQNKNIWYSRVYACSLFAVALFQRFVSLFVLSLCFSGRGGRRHRCRHCGDAASDQVSVGGTEQRVVGKTHISSRVAGRSGSLVSTISLPPSQTFQTFRNKCVKRLHILFYAKRGET